MNLDPNRDGKLDIADMTEIMDNLSRGEYNENADFDGNGKLDINDLTSLQDALSKQNGVVITLDPGHGEGYNTVKYPDFTYSEGTRMYTYALMLERELVRRGYTVYLTRRNVQDDPTLLERAKIAALHKSDVLLSLHSNAKDDDPDKKGMVVVYGSADKEFNKPFGWAVAEADATVMKNGIVDVFWSESKSHPGEDYFGILRYAARNGVKRALIIEHGYHSNEGEARFLSDDANLGELARVEAAAIDNYLRENLKHRMYRVQVGVYALKANADKLRAKLKAKGFSSFCEKETLVYRVFSGSYTSAENAEEKKKELEAAGFKAVIKEVEIE